MMNTGPNSYLCVCVRACVRCVRRGGVGVAGGKRGDGERGAGGSAGVVSSFVVEDARRSLLNGENKREDGVGEGRGGTCLRRKRVGIRLGGGEGVTHTDDTLDATNHATAPAHVRFLTEMSPWMTGSGRWHLNCKKRTTLM
jgi:hypothetical protein